MMLETKIVIDISDTGEINAETFNMVGTGCVDELDKLLKDLALESKLIKKEEFFKNSIKTENTIKVKK